MAKRTADILNGATEGGKKPLTSEGVVAFFDSKFQSSKLRVVPNAYKDPKKNAAMNQAAKQFQKVKK